MNQEEIMFLLDIEYKLEEIAKKSKDIDIKAEIREIKHSIDEFRDNDYIKKLRRKANREINSRKKIVISNAGTKLHIPCSMETLLSREQMKGMKSEYKEWVIKHAIKEWINMRINIEYTFEKMAKECNVVLPDWKKYVV